MQAPLPAGLWKLQDPSHDWVLQNRICPAEATPARSGTAASAAFIFVGDVRGVVVVAEEYED